jgi:hypothetical protein
MGRFEHCEACAAMHRDAEEEIANRPEIEKFQKIMALKPYDARSANCFRSHL